MGAMASKTSLEALAPSAHRHVISRQMKRATHHRVEGAHDSLVGAGAFATQAVAGKNTRPSRRRGPNKHARALAARKLRQERHVYSHDLEQSLPSSVGAACERSGSERFPLCSRRPPVNFMPLLRSLGAT